MNVGSKVLLDPNLALIPHDNLGDHPSRYENSGCTSDDGDYEEHLDNPAGSHSLAFFDDPNASSSRVGLDLSEEP